VGVLNYHAGTVEELAASTGSVVQTIDVGDIVWCVLCDGIHAWVTNQGGDTVVSITPGVLSGTLNKKSTVGSISIRVQVTERVTTVSGKKRVKTDTTVSAAIPLTIT
jgi:hypothetical protein